MGNKQTNRNSTNNSHIKTGKIDNDRKKNENSWGARSNNSPTGSNGKKINNNKTTSSSSKPLHITNNKEDKQKLPRLSKVESISDPKYLKDRDEWMNNNNPFATDLDNTRIFVRGIRKIEVDDLDDLFSTDKDLYLNTGLTPIAARHQFTTDVDSINGSMSGLSTDEFMSPKTSMADSSNLYLEFDEDLTKENSRLFRKATEIYAFRTDDPCIFTKDWGQNEAKPGDYIVVGNQHSSSSSSSDNDDSNQGNTTITTEATTQNKNDRRYDIYVISAEEFETNYVPAVGRPNQYIKKKAVRACRVNEPFILKRAVEDQIQVGNVGDYIVQSGTRQYIVRANKFDRNYILARSYYASRLTSTVGPSRIKSFGSGLKYPEWGVLHESVPIESLESLTMYDDKLIKVLNEEMFHWGCDVFKIAEMTCQWPLVHMGWHLINSHYGLCKKLNINEEMFLKFLIEVDDAYLPNPYHSNLHGGDVMTSSHYIAKQTGFLDQMNDLELFSLLIAGLTHDIAHPGTSNSFQVNAQSAIAIRYNDHSVLENFHAATTFEILSNEQFKDMFPKVVDIEIFNDKKEKEIAKANFLGTFRKYIIELVLATDLAKEVADPILNLFRQKTKVIAGTNDKPSLNFHDRKDRLLCLKMTIKCSDIAHGAKPLELHKRWSKLVTEEFLSQFEKENDLRLPHAFIVSEDPVKYAKSQAGFIRFVVLKCYADFCTYVGEVGDEFKRNIKLNISHWNESKRAIVASEHRRKNSKEKDGRQQLSLSLSHDENSTKKDLLDIGKDTIVRNRIRSKDHREISGDERTKRGDSTGSSNGKNATLKVGGGGGLKGNTTASMHHILLESASIFGDDSVGESHSMEVPHHRIKARRVNSAENI